MIRTGLIWAALALLTVLPLSACEEGLDVDGVRNMRVKGGLFHSTLHARYMDLTDERLQAEDQDGAGYFLARARKAARGKAVYPDKLDDADLERALRHDFTESRMETVRLLERGADVRSPADAAEAVAAFDCWLRQALADREQSCRKRFEQALGKIAAPLRMVTVVLLRDFDGGVGSVAVGNEHGESILTRAGEMTQVSTDDPIPSQPRRLTPGEIAELYRETLAAHPIPPKRFILYFEQGSSELTGQSRALLVDIIEEVARRDHADVSVIGHTDRVSSETFNKGLALQRTRRVRDELIGQGVDAERLHARSHGENDPLVETPDGVAEPRNRRVEVIVR